MPETFGFLNIDKPLHLTSHDVVARVRRGFKIKKVGHAGTLDPLATGVLIICVGRATRMSEYAMASRKQYRAVIELGKSTTTYDAEGEFVTEVDASYLTQEDIQAVLPTFTGAIEQLPPMHSAVKQGGKKLYELAREGKTVERKARNVTIYDLTISAWDLPRFTLDVTCSSGTYIRSLAHDIGAALGVGGYLAGLVRTASGAFRVENALQLDDVLADPDWQRHLLPADHALAEYPAIELNATDVDHVLHGRLPQAITQPPADETLARAYNPEGEFIAILRADEGGWRPHKVFAASN